MDPGFCVRESGDGLRLTSDSTFQLGGWLARFFSYSPTYICLPSVDCWNVDFQWDNGEKPDCREGEHFRRICFRYLDEPHADADKFLSFYSIFYLYFIDNQ